MAQLVQPAMLEERLRRIWYAAPAGVGMLPSTCAQDLRRNNPNNGTGLAREINADLNRAARRR
jgi:hypothetical protein